MTVNNTKFFKFGDRVVHLKRPEWGHGTITKVESVQHEGEAAQRLHVRFSGVGLKVMNTAFAPLAEAKDVKRLHDESCGDDGCGGEEEREIPTPIVARNGVGSANGSGKRRVDSIGGAIKSPAPVDAGKDNGGRGPADHGKGWLAALERRDPEAVMLDIPECAKDPFRSVWERLQDSLDLYRFTTNSRSVLDWAIAQSGLEDPLTRFNRQEIEIFFNRWMRIRDQHLFITMQEAERVDADRAAGMLSQANQFAQQAMRRLYARR